MFGIQLDGKVGAWYRALLSKEKDTWATLRGSVILEYSPSGPKWSLVNQLNQIKQKKSSLRDYIAKIKHLNTRCEPHERVNDEQLLSQFLLGLISPKLQDPLIVLNITSFEVCSKEAIRLGDNMREGDKTIVTLVPSIMETKDSDVGSSRNSKEISKEAKGMNVDKLIDLVVARLNPQAKGAAQRGTQGNTFVSTTRHGLVQGVHRESSIQQMSKTSCEAASLVVWTLC